MFNFTSLLGAHSDTRATQSILELDGGVKVLVDVGWDDRFDTRQLAELEKHIPTLSFILLTHATISHLGAFAHCCKHIPLFTQLPVYATSPVIAFGRTLSQDLYSSSPLAATFISNTATSENEASGDETNRTDILRQAPTLEEINRYFSLITPLKYSQPHQPNASYFSAPLEGLTLTAYNAGHTLGGTIWHIQHGMESIVHAVDWHQARENVIAGAAWFGGIGGGEVIEQLRKPTALVCSSANGNRVALSGGRKARDETLIGHIRSSLAKGGTVLIPTDSSARMLELSWLLEKTWHESKDETIKKSKVFMASRSAHATLRYARSLLEWMDDSIVREFEGEDENVTKTHQRSGSKQANGITKSSRPFEFRHVKIVERKSQLERCFKGDGPRVILASDISLDWGFSQNMFEHIAVRTENLIILTEHTTTNQTRQRPPMVQTLWQWFQERQDGVALETTTGGEQLEQVHTGGRSLNLHYAQRLPLDTFETQKYQQYMATQRQMQDSLLASDNRQVGADDDAMDDDDESSSSESDDSEDEQQGKALNVSAALGHGSRNKVAVSDEDLGVSVLIRRKGIFDYDVRNKRGRNAVFPHTHSRRRGDEFGDFIKPEDFLREEEKEEQDSSAEKQSNLLGQKRKWDEINKAKTDHSSKRHQASREDNMGQGQDEEMESSDSSSESETEAAESKDDDSQLPSKAVFSEKSVNVNARLAFVDFSGLHDQRSLQMLIPLIGPKKLILTAGTKQETSALAADCRELLRVKTASSGDQAAVEIFSPQTGETVDASVDTNAWVVKLSRDLAKRLQWQNVKNIGIVTITGQLRAEPLNVSDTIEPSQAKKLKMEEEVDSSAENLVSKVDYEPVLEPIPVSLAASTRSSSQPVHVGDLRLADLRRLMNAAGHSAEFRGEGTLLVDTMIAVRKLPNGRIVVEGAPVSSLVPMNTRGANTFTQVKQKIYEGLAVVAAS